MIHNVIVALKSSLFKSINWPHLFVRKKDVIVKYPISIYCHTQNYPAEKEEIITENSVFFDTSGQ